MSRKLGTWVVLTVGLLCLAGLGASRAVHSTTGTIPAPASPDETLEGRFATRVRPFLEAIALRVTAQRSRGPTSISAATPP